MAGPCGIVSAPLIPLTGEGLSWISCSFHFGFATCKVNWAWFGVGFRADGGNLSQALKNRESKRKRTPDQKDERKSAIHIQLFGQGSDPGGLLALCWSPLKGAVLEAVLTFQGVTALLPRPAHLSPGTCLRGADSPLWEVIDTDWNCYANTLCYSLPYRFSPGRESGRFLQGFFLLFV